MNKKKAKGYLKAHSHKELYIDFVNYLKTILSVNKVDSLIKRYKIKVVSIMTLSVRG